MRFIYVVDIYLDSLLNGLFVYLDVLVEQLCSVIWDVFIRLVDCVIEEVVDFMVIVGDFYDGVWCDFNIGSL